MKEEIYEDSYGFDCECAEDEFVRKMETLEEIEQLQQENQQYKNAWEELKEDCREVEKANDYILYERLQQLEQKYGIGE